MINWKIVTVFVCIFLAGGIAGGFVGMRIGHTNYHKGSPFSAESKEQRRRPVEDWSKRFDHDLIHRVGVTPEQRAKMEPLIQETRANFRHLREQSFQKAGEIAQKFDEQISALLTEEQKPKYQQLVNERNERLKHMEPDRMRMPKPGFPPPGPPPEAPGGSVPPPDQPPAEEGPQPAKP
jgi:Spy/CpxP family protein refolding chaperone